MVIVTRAQSFRVVTPQSTIRPNPYHDTSRALRSRSLACPFMPWRSDAEREPPLLPAGRPVLDRIVGFPSGEPGI